MALNTLYWPTTVHGLEVRAQTLPLIRGVSEKHLDWCHPPKNSESTLQVLVKLISWSLKHCPFLLCHVWVYSWKDSSKVPYRCRQGLCNLVHVIKITPRKVGRVGRLFRSGGVHLGQELSNAQGTVSRTVVMKKQPRVVPPQISPPSRAVSDANAASWSSRHAWGQPRSVQEKNVVAGQLMTALQRQCMLTVPWASALEPSLHSPGRAWWIFPLFQGSFKDRVEVKKAVPTELLVS